MPKSTARPKVKKPRPDFPLFPHASGRWAKKVKGRFRYFGKVAEDPKGEAALEKWLEQKDDLLAGRTPRPAGDSLSLKDACNHFIHAKKQLVLAGELSPRSEVDYVATCKTLTLVFGRLRPVADLRPDDFDRLRTQLAKRRGPVALGNEIQRVRSVFKHALDYGLIDQAVRFGPSFRKPSKRVLRLERAKNGPRMFTPAELRLMLDHLDGKDVVLSEVDKETGEPVKVKGERSPGLRAMILLAMNCGYGNGDCGKLPLDALDLDGGWVTFHRPKTGTFRRSALWPETVESLRQWLTRRPRPKSAEHKKLVFITKRRLSWAKTTGDSPVSKEFRKLLDKLGLYRKGLSFYALRHVFATVAGESGDQVVVDHVMGHIRDDMASVYRESISDERRRRLADHVHAWLFDGGERE